MSTPVVPTKGNLIAVKKSLELAKGGFDLLDRKRNILIRELMMLIKHAGSIQDKIDDTYSSAYEALKRANITLGICSEIAGTVPIDETLKLSYRSVMGVEIPIVSLREKESIVQCNNISDLDEIVKSGKVAKIHLNNTDESVRKVESYLTGGEVLGFGLEKEQGQDIITLEKVDTTAFVSRRS